MKTYSSIRLEVTSQCNLKCSYCHNSQYNNQSNDMSHDNILKLIREIKATYPINKILITGGEPLVCDDIYGIIAEISSLGIKADMVTNGTMLSQDVLEKLERAGLKRIRVSIDDIGNSPAMRLATNPDSIWKKAELVSRHSSIELCIHTVCSPYNARSLYNIYKRTLEVGARRWRVFDLGYQGGFIENKEIFSLEQYYDDLIESTGIIISDYIKNGLSKVLDIEINNIFRTVMLNANGIDNPSGIKALNEAKQNKSPCDYVADHQLSIRSNGIATLCQYFHNPIFDFAHYDYEVQKTIAHKLWTDEDELLNKNLIYCNQCKYFLVCNSGCRARALYLTGSITEADPCACYITPRVHKEIVTLLPEDTQSAYNSYINPEGKPPKFSRKDLMSFLQKRGY